MLKPKGFFASSTFVKRPHPAILSQCGACKLCKKCKSPKMSVTGDGQKRVLVVAEAPGTKEDEEGTQLVGGAGQCLRRVLRSLDFNLDRDAWKIDAVACKPPKNRHPTSKEVRYCRPNIARTIKTLQPETIILLGQAAVSSVIGSVWKESPGEIGRWVGWRIPCQTDNTWICPTWHPTYILDKNDPTTTQIWMKHLAAAIGLNDRPWDQVPNWSADVRRILDPAEAARWLRKAATQTNGAVAFDYECNCLKPDGPDAQIESCAVAWGRNEPEHVIAYPWHGEAVQATASLLRSPIPKIGANIKFEDRWTRKHLRHRVRGWVWDSMLAAHVCDNRPHITSIDFQAFVRLGQPSWDHHIKPFFRNAAGEATNQMCEIETNDLLRYNGLDALLEFRVAIHQMKELGVPIPWST